MNKPLKCWQPRFLDSDKKRTTLQQDNAKLHIWRSWIILQILDELPYHIYYIVELAPKFHLLGLLKDGIHRQYFIKLLINNQFVQPIYITYIHCVCVGKSWTTHIWYVYLNLAVISLHDDNSSTPYCYTSTTVYWLINAALQI